MGLKLYYDLMSQPSRALYILLKTAKYNFEPKQVNLRGGEHFTEEYALINKFRKVPVIDFNGFILTESIAIIRYLSRENIIPKSLYPPESKAQARVDEYLEWQHVGLRLHCAMYFRVKYLAPITSGQPADPKQLAGYERRMFNAIQEFDTLWLGKHEYVCGDTITVADLMAAVELEQPRMAGIDPAERFPNIAAWWPKVRQHFNPYYDEAHVILNKIVNKNSASKL
ncbi:glutathione S-transferase theta-1-like [Zerene cesonia]|uniref:glutathione S-transferase theta-1-like n=1 Tax=Zerene cesonia TaxID=33412 RepID=UPI0018E55691|nr:glutathione S-transferase theta-1-like [Zerene cesonia]